MINEYIAITRRRKLRHILQKIVRLKTIVIVFISLLVFDFLLTKTLGDGYEDRFTFLSWIITTFLIYVIFGLGLYFTRLIERRRNYYLVPSLIAAVVISLVLLLAAMEFLPSWEILHNTLITLFLSFIIACILLVLLQIKKLKKSHLFSLFGQIRTHKIGISINVLLLLILASVVYFGNAQLQTVNKRLETIENKLGGTKKLACDEKESIRKVRQSVVRIIGGEAEGSGFAIDSKGLILTNFHVIEFEPSPKIVLPDNTFETAEVLMGDKDADLAILKIDKHLPVVSFGNSSDLEPSDELLAIGYPLGGSLAGESSVNKGYLAAKRYSKDVGVEYLQTDTTLNHGVSGGPMINICGEVVGINTAGLSGLGLAISSYSIQQKWLAMSTSEEPLKDIAKITFDDTESAEFAVATFYNYLKVRKLEKAFELLSDNFKNGHGFDYWKGGYTTLLDTTVINIADDKDKKDRVSVKLSTKDMVDGEIVYKYFEGYWDVRNVNGKWRLWDPEIKEVEEPSFLWFYE